MGKTRWERSFAALRMTTLYRDEDGAGVWEGGEKRPPGKAAATETGLTACFGAARRLWYIKSHTQRRRVGTREDTG
jgi:hypothetical protein